MQVRLPGGCIADGGSHQIEEDFGDVLHRGDDAGRAEFLGVVVQVLVIESGKNDLVGDPLERAECEIGLRVAQRDGNAWLESVVVPVPSRVVAVAEDGTIFLRRKFRDVEAVGRGEIELLADQDRGWVAGRHLDRMVGGEAECQSLRPGLSQLAVRCGEKLGHQFHGVLLGVGPACTLDQGDQPVPDDLIQHLDIHEVAGLRVRISDGVDRDFVVSPEPFHGGFPPEPVPRSAIGVPGGGIDAESDRARETNHG